MHQHPQVFESFCFPPSRQTRRKPNTVCTNNTVPWPPTKNNGISSTNNIPKGSSQETEVQKKRVRSSRSRSSQTNDVGRKHGAKPRYGEIHRKTSHTPYHNTVVTRADPSVQHTRGATQRGWLVYYITSTSQFGDNKCRVRRDKWYSAC